MSAVVLIVGIPGAGKSTVGRALAARFDRSALIEGDLVQHHFTVSGLVGPGESPPEESYRQLALRWRNCAALADNFADEGFTVIVEHAASVRFWVDLFREHLRTPSLSVIVLAPAKAVAIERDRDRTEKQVAHLFAHMDSEMRTNLADVGWWIDTSNLSVDQTVDAILSQGLVAGALDSGGRD